MQLKLKAESIKSLTEPTKCSEKKQLYSVTSESSVRDKKVILTTDPHGHTRTGRYKAGKLGGWEVRKLRAREAQR